MISRARLLWPPMWSALLLAAAAQAARADDGVPNYNVKPECSFTQSVIPAPENETQCLKEERAARAKLQQNWANYPSADRSECVGESSTGGSPSYVDLLTCLEMTADARAMQRKAKSGQ
jgi:hypothetical protein